jgi:ABC-2 type transport system permease protein
MSAALFRTSLTTHSQTMLSYAIGMAAYLWIFIWVYPYLTKSPALNTLLQSLPQGLLQVIGYQAGVSQVSDFLAGEFYGLIYLIILAIYAVTTSNRLMAHAVDNGSMAYLLSTPVSRTRIAVTQVAVLVFGVVFIGGFTTLAGVLGVQWFVQNPHLDVARFVEMNLVGVLLFLVVGAYCFVFSCIARDERTALSLSGVITTAFYAFKMVGSLDDHVSWLKNLSIFSAFNPQDLVHGQVHVWPLTLLLLVAAVALFGIAVAGFRRREMSL